MSLYDDDMLDGIGLRRSDDDMKRELEVFCIDCGAYLCDAEDGDSLGVLARVAVGNHACPEVTA